MSEPQISQEPKPAAQLATKEIVLETHELHAQFRHLSERLTPAPAGEHAEIREQMQPLVSRERELRQVLGGRAPRN
jgi:hypothetical protein